MANVNCVAVSLRKGSLTVGETTTAYVDVCPENACYEVAWESSNPCVASVSSLGVVFANCAGRVKIIASVTDVVSGKVTTAFNWLVVSEPSSGTEEDTGTGTGTINIPVQSVTVCPPTMELTLGESAVLEVTVCPENATNRGVDWRSRDTAVATVNPNSGLVRAVGEGTTAIIADAVDGSNKRGGCTVVVKKPVPATSVTVCPKRKTLGMNDIAILHANVCPCEAAVNPVKWFSSDPSVATVGTYTGIVTPVSSGTTTITALVANGSVTDTCTITVDFREKAIIKKDSHSFYVKFSDGKIWRFIGLDLSKRTDNYQASYPPSFDRENYDGLIAEEQRYLDNITTTFSVNQISYLYLFDPLGIEYYMKFDACRDKDVMSGEFLAYKDEVYKAIFGNFEKEQGRFYFKIIDGDVVYGRYDGYNRMDVYSNAEVLFGSHTIFDWSAFFQSIAESIFGNIPAVSHVLLGVEVYQALFFSGSIVGAAGGVASEFLDDYAKETKNKVLEKMLGWPKTVFDCLSALVSAVVEAFQLNNLNDLTIYSKIQEQNYLTVFEDDETELSIGEIISKCSNH